MRKINVGCGPNVLSKPWENIDTQVYNVSYDNKNFTKVGALDFDYSDAEFILAGHFLEHLSLEDGKKWLKKVSDEAPKAKLLIAIPAIDRAVTFCSHEFLQIVASYPNTPYDENTRGGFHSSLWRCFDLLKELNELGYKKIIEVSESELLTGHANWQYAIEAEK